MPETTAPPAFRKPVGKDFATILLVLGAILAVIFSKSFSRDYVLFANDAPLGLIYSESGQQASTLKGLVTGYWQDLNWVGVEQPSILPSLSFWIYQIFRDPVLNAKFYSPLSLFFLGISAWLFFRQLGLGRAACVLGGIAAALNMNTFSHAMWGLPSRALAQASIFLALAAIQSATIRHFWIKAVLGGMAVGMAVMEGFDVGALYSLYVAAFALFVCLIQRGTRGQRFGRGIGFLAVIAICAGWLAAHALNTLIGTQIKGVAGMQQDEASKAQRWDSATMWSLPKIETSRVLFPGLFGYGVDMMGYIDHDEGSWYWGGVGQNPGDPRTRHSGAGEYAGTLVIIIGAWAAASAFRKKNSPFSDIARKHLLFWLVAAIVSLLLAWGRHAPFYRIIYSLPYFSTIRNPIKFMHMFHLAFLTLFAFGVDGLMRQYVARPANATLGIFGQLKAWWKGLKDFDKRWAVGAVCFGVAMILGYLIFVSSSRELIGHLKTGGFPDSEAQLISKFATRDFAIHVVVFVISLLAVFVIQSGWFAGNRARYAAILIGVILVPDLAAGNAPWIFYYNYKERYQSSPLFDILRQDAREQRITARLAPFSDRWMILDQQHAGFPGLYHFWLQNQFQYFNMRALEVAQMPRVPELDLNFMQNLGPRRDGEGYLIARQWQLTSTRYLLCQTAYKAAVLDAGVLPGKNAFQVRSTFEVVAKGPNARGTNPDDITTQIVPQGSYALLEYTNVLPRLSLFSKWQVLTNDQQTLASLRDAAFDPFGGVLISDPIANSAAVTNRPGKAEFARYTPKDFDVRTESTEPSVLMVTDKFSPHWKVWVDGKPDTVLRVNYIMRGVQVPAGTHTVTFRYQPPIDSLYATGSAIVVGLLLCGFLGWKWKTDQKKVT